MNKTIIYILAGTVLAVGLFAFKNSLYSERREDSGLEASHKNIAYIIEEKSVLLTNGFSEVKAAPGSASKIITRYFGNEVRHDFHNDGQEDVAFR